jgi:hypothetical protein
MTNDYFLGDERVDFDVIAEKTASRKKFCSSNTVNYLPIMCINEGNDKAKYVAHN